MVVLMDSHATGSAAVSPNDPILRAALSLVADDAVKLPPIPTVVARLSEQLGNPSCELRDVARLVGTDQALAAHILRCASSTLLAARSQPASLEEAVMRVGTNGLFALSVSFCLGRDTARPSPLQGLRRDAFRRAAAAAEFSRRLSKPRRLDPDRGFLCGLFGNFGHTVALGAIEQVLAARDAKESRPAEAWMEIARLCEEQIALDAAAKWGMPKVVLDVIAARRSGAADGDGAAFHALLRAAETLTELFYRKAAPEEADIVEEIGCSAEEAADIAECLPAVAAAVLALGAPADDLRLTQSIQIPIVEAPQTTLKGSVVPVSIPITVERKSGDQHMMCVGLASDGFVATGTQALPHNQVVKCRLLGVEEDFELVAFVAAVNKENEYRFEMKPMGLTGPTARKWQKLRGGPGGPNGETGPMAVAAAPTVEVVRTRPGPEAPAAPARQAGYVSLHADRGSPLKRIGGWFRGRSDSDKR
jgi:HD-like signal output (HDOD) protein